MRQPGLLKQDGDFGLRGLRQDQLADSLLRRDVCVRAVASALTIAGQRGPSGPIPSLTSSADWRRHKLVCAGKTAKTAKA